MTHAAVEMMGHALRLSPKRCSFCIEARAVFLSCQLLAQVVIQYHAGFVSNICLVCV